LILDTSVLVAIIAKEASQAHLKEQMKGANSLSVGAPSLLEAVMVLSTRTQTDARELIDNFLAEFNIGVIPFGQEHFELAADAFIRYGKGRHPAGLNFGDCLSYAAARHAGLPLLYVGDDFGQTDVNT